MREEESGHSYCTHFISMKAYRIAVKRVSSIPSGFMLGLLYCIKHSGISVLCNALFGFIALNF